MHILRKLRHAFGGGINLAIDLPKDFAWEDKVIPIRVHLTSKQPQSDAGGELRFYFYDEEKGTRSNSGTENGLNHRWMMHTPIELAAGATQTLEVGMPLPFDSEARASIASEFESSRSIGEKLAASLTLGNMTPPTHLQWFRLRVSLKREGVLFSARASEKIRCRNAKTQFSIGPLRF